MKAWRLEKIGGRLTLEDVPVPEPRPGSVLVKVEASALMSYLKAYVEGKLPFYNPPAKPSYEGRHVKRQVLVSVNSDYQTGCAPCQPRIRRDPAIPNHDPCIREKEFLAAGPIFTSAP